MPDENIQSIVDNAFVDNPTEMRSAFYDAINDKIFAALEQRKQELAQNFMSQYDDGESETGEEYEEVANEKPQEESAESTEEEQTEQ